MKVGASGGNNLRGRNRRGEICKLLALRLIRASKNNNKIAKGFNVLIYLNFLKVILISFKVISCKNVR